MRRFRSGPCGGGDYDTPEYAARVAASASPILSDSQLALLAEHGEERTAEQDEVLFRIGDARYPLIVILEGEAAVLDADGRRDRASRPVAGSSAS